MSNIFDLIVIGGGPAGYLGAERAAKRGLKTALFEKNALGGVCLNEGCVPSKTMLNSAKLYEHARNGMDFGVNCREVSLDHQAVMARRAGVIQTLVAGVSGKMRAAGVKVFRERAVIDGRDANGYIVKAGGETYIAQRLLITAGASPIIPALPGVDENLRKTVVTSREVLALENVPSKLVIIGGNAVGLEMAQYYAAAGAEVTVVEMRERIAGDMDPDVSSVLMSALEKRGVRFVLEHTLVAADAEGCTVSNRDGEKLHLRADKVLLAVGRCANIQDLGLETIGVETDFKGIKTDEQCRTNVENVYAAGDITGRDMLAHAAYRAAEVAVNTMLGKQDIMRRSAIPAVIYTSPEAVSVGMTEAAAADAGIDYEVKKLPMMYSGRFVAENADLDGFCKVLVNKEHRNVIGVHMVGSYSSEIIWGAAAMIETELRVADIREIVFPHPTVSEMIRETVWEFAD